MQKWERIHFNSISDKYATSLYFDEFIVSLSLIAWLIDN